MVSPLEILEFKERIDSTKNALLKNFKELKWTDMRKLKLDREAYVAIECLYQLTEKVVLFNMIYL